jgi:hypothetical protein
MKNFHLKKSKHIISAIFASGLINCTDPPHSVMQASILTEVDTSTINENTLQYKPILIQDTLQFTDENGLKQGLWKEYLNGKLWKEERYLNNTLHGLCNEYGEDGVIYQSSYNNGKKNGLSQTFIPGSVTALFATFYLNDDHQWLAYPYEMVQYIVPVKGPRTELDSTTIKIYYLSGQLLYEGKFHGSKTGAAQGFGIHNSYYENGKNRSVLNYNSDSITTYDQKGNMQQMSGIRKYRGVALK